MRIGIVIPSGDMVHTDFSMSLTMLMVQTSKVPELQVALFNPRSSLVQKGRWDGVRQALSLGCDAICFIDSDQTFPPDALLRLLKHDLPIVGATCLTRREPIQYVVRNSSGKRIDFADKVGLHQVISNGFPFCLIKAEVFEAVPEPWFTVGYHQGSERWISEDESFCHAAFQKGYDTWVDADLTKQVGHLGVTEYI